jgi:transposase
LARSAGAVWRLEEHPQAVQPPANKGVWQRLFEHLAAEPDNEYAMIDSTIVRARRRSKKRR